ncbi:BlaI/MecI/CopY family transcriptional regulator [Chlamydiales bacterium]|nr:BlaI/MecI/CopY family transcriptional regulator [Chlamydiales bacterium]
MTKKRFFGELEAQIHQIIHKGGQMTVKQVQNALGKSDHYTTVMTVMNRLVIKGELKRRKVKRHYEYWIQEGKKRGLSLLKQIKHSLFEGNTLAMISTLIEEGEDISHQDLMEIERLIHNKIKNP